LDCTGFNKFGPDCLHLVFFVLHAFYAGIPYPNPSASVS
jgi:hypothetical protein